MGNWENGPLFFSSLVPTSLLFFKKVKRECSWIFLILLVHSFWGWTSNMKVFCEILGMQYRVKIKLSWQRTSDLPNPKEQIVKLLLPPYSPCELPRGICLDIVGRQGAGLKELLVWSNEETLEVFFKKMVVQRDRRSEVPHHPSFV